MKAVAVLRGDSGVSGVIVFEQSDQSSPVQVQVELTGLAPGRHGLHIHQLGDLTNGLVTFGPHFNPTGKRHGGRSDSERHVGDLGNVEASSDGIAKVIFEDRVISLFGEHSVIGRGIAVKEDQDDLGKGGHELSLSTGNTGARLAGGVIGNAE